MTSISMDPEFHDEVLARLRDTGTAGSGLRSALAILALIIRWIPETPVQGRPPNACSKNATELADLLGMHIADFAKVLKVLEGIGAIRRVRNGLGKLILVGTYADDFKPSETVARYRVAVAEQPPAAS